jgi:type IV secretion system protein VirB10
MAFLREERIDEQERASAVSRRPAIVATLVVSAVVALVITARGSTEQSEEDELPAEFVLEPDHAGAARTLAEAEASTKARAHREPLPEAALGPASLEGDSLGVHPIPALDGSGYDPAQGGSGAVSTFFAAQQQMGAQHLLSTRQAELEAKVGARDAPMRVASFTVHQQAQFERAAALLGGGSSMPMVPGMPAGLPNMQDLAALGAAPAIAALSGVRGPGAAVAPAQPVDPMLSANKLEFFERGGEQLAPGRLQADVELPESEFELQMGSIIPGVLISGINAEVPGQIIGQVSEQVYDSATGRHLLIPQGSRLVGTYNATVANGQSRVQIAWTRLNFPDGRKLDLGGMAGTDQAGVSGFRDRVNRHFGARLAAALMTSAFTVTYEVTAPQNGNLYGSAVHRGVGESIVQLGLDMARQEGQRPPTLEIRPGYRFSISVSKDIVFPSAYEDGIARRKSRP